MNFLLRYFVTLAFASWLLSVFTTKR